MAATLAIMDNPRGKEGLAVHNPMSPRHSAGVAKKWVVGPEEPSGRRLNRLTTIQMIAATMISIRRGVKPANGLAPRALAFPWVVAPATNCADMSIFGPPLFLLVFARTDTDHRCHAA